MSSPKTILDTRQVEMRAALDNAGTEAFTPLNEVLAALDNSQNQFKIKPESPVSTRVVLSPATIVKDSGAQSSSTIRNKLIDFEGVVIDFQTGEIFEIDGVTPYLSGADDFTPVTTAADQYCYYAISLEAGSINPDNTIQLSIKVQASTPNLSLASAPKATFLPSIAVAQLYIQANPVNTSILNIDWANIIQMGATGGSYVAGPASSTNEALARFDGTDGKTIKNSTVTLSDAGVISGLTGLSTSGTTSVTDLTVSANLNLTGDTTDSTTTGSNAVIASSNTVVTRLTNSSLVSVGGYDSTTAGARRIIVNATGNPITIINQDATVTANNRIVTGTGANIVVPSGGSVEMVYNATSNRHRMLATSGNYAIDQHIANPTAAHAASSVSNTPSGNLAATDVQGALNELQSDVDTRVVASGGTLTNGSIVTPARSDVKQDTLANLTTYAASASNGQIVYATDEKQMYQVVDGSLVGIGGAGIVKLTAGQDLNPNELVYISRGTGSDISRTAGRVYRAAAGNEDRVDVLGFVTKSATTGNTVEVQVSGIMKGFSGLTAGSVYYASTTGGQISLTPPSANGQWIVAVGLATSATEMVINPVASASAIYIVDADTTFTLANNQTATDVTGLLFDPIATRAFIIDYSIYRQTDTGGSAVARSGQLRAVYNTQASTWSFSDDFCGHGAGIDFSVQPSGQVQYGSTNIAGANYVGTLKYTIRKTFGV